LKLLIGMAILIEDILKYIEKLQDTRL
jgi:hypothetical protein